MDRFYPSYAESSEDCARGFSSSVHEDGSEVQPSFGDNTIEIDTASTPGFTHVPDFAYRKKAPPPHRSSDPFPVHGTTFSYGTPYYAASEPSPELNGSKCEHSYKGKAYESDRTVRDLEEHKQRLERSKQQVKKWKLENKALEELAESRGVLLFHRLKKDKDYHDAEKLYEEIVKRRGSAESEDTAILDLKQSFATILIEQKKLDEAEPISREVWEKRKQCPGPLSEASKDSHRQLCSVLCAMRKHKDAENMHRSMYQRETRDPWALENGDEVCLRLREQGEIKRAKEMQDEVWKERLKQNGPRDGSTIRSGLRLIGFFEELVTNIDNQGGTDAEQRLCDSQKKTFEFEIEVILRKIWETRLHPEPNTDILNAGHKLGVILFLQEHFPDAELTFRPVWESRRHLGDSAISTGIMLGRALCRQDKQETYRRAVDVLQGIWESLRRKEDAEAISSCEDLAQAYFSLGDWPNAEITCKWVADQKAQKRVYPMQEIEDAHWMLGQTFYKQGKSSNAERVLGGLYQQWNARCPNLARTLECGCMLTQSLSAQKKFEDASKIALEVFNRRRGSMKRGIAYLDSARLYGLSLLEVGKSADAEKTLQTIWEDQVEGAEAQKMRLKCGHLYGRALSERKKYPEAKKILETVAEAQRAVSAGAHEIAETRQLLKDVDQLKKEKDKEKRNSGRRRRLYL